MSKYAITMCITVSTVIHQVSGSQDELREILEKLAREEGNLAVTWLGEEMTIADIDITGIYDGNCDRIKCNENNHRWEWAGDDWECQVCGVSAAAVFLPLLKETETNAKDVEG